MHFQLTDFQYSEGNAFSKWANYKRTWSNFIGPSSIRLPEQVCVPNLCESSCVIANGPFYDYNIAVEYLRLHVYLRSIRISLMCSELCAKTKFVRNLVPKIATTKGISKPVSFCVHVVFLTQKGLKRDRPDKCS